MTSDDLNNLSQTPPGEARGVIHTVSSRDVDDQAALLHGWKQTYAQMSAGAFTGTFSEARFEDVHLFVESTSQALFQSGELPYSVVAIGVPLQMAGTAIFCGAVDHEAAVHAFSGRGGSSFTPPVDSSWEGSWFPGARCSKSSPNRKEN